MGDGDGRPEVFVRARRRDQRVGRRGRPTAVAARTGRGAVGRGVQAGAEAALLLAGAEQIYVVDAISGELKERRPPPAVGLVAPGGGRFGRRWAKSSGSWLLPEDRSRSERMSSSWGDSLAAPPVLGDLDGDGLMEVVLLARGGAIHALRADGLRQANFPVALPRFAEVGELVFEPVLCDVDADGKQEIFVAGHSGIFGVEDDGRLLPGFPLLMAAPPTASPVVVNLDGDGRLALAALDGEAANAWDLLKVAAHYAGGAGPLAAGRCRCGWVADRAGSWPARCTARGGLARPGLLLSQSSRPG